MVPGEIVLLQHFPYLPSGKVDKRKLESEYQSKLIGDSDESNVAVPPTERVVQQALQDILGSFSKRIRLAAAGLDSLAAIRVASNFEHLALTSPPLPYYRPKHSLGSQKLCEVAKSKPSSESSEEFCFCLN